VKDNVIDELYVLGERLNTCNGNSFVLFMKFKAEMPNGRKGSRRVSIYRQESTVAQF